MKKILLGIALLHLAVLQLPIAFGEDSLRDKVSQYTQNEQSKIYTLQGLSGATEGGLAITLYKYASQLKPDSEKIKQLKTEIDTRENWLKVEKKLNATNRINNPDITESTYSSVRPSSDAQRRSEPTFDSSNDNKGSSIRERKNWNPQVSSKIDTVTAEMNSLKAELKQVEGSIISRYSKKGFRVVSTATGLVLVLDMTSRAYLMFIEDTDPGLFPVVEMGANALDTPIGDQSIFDVFTNASSKVLSTLREIKTK